MTILLPGRRSNVAENLSQTLLVLMNLIYTCIIYIYMSVRQSSRGVVEYQVRHRLARENKHGRQPVPQTWCVYWWFSMETDRCVCSPCSAEVSQWFCRTGTIYNLWPALISQMMLWIRTGIEFLTVCSNHEMNCQVVPTQLWQNGTGWGEGRMGRGGADGEGRWGRGREGGGPGGRDVTVSSES